MNSFSLKKGWIINHIKTAIKFLRFPAIAIIFAIIIRLFVFNIYSVPSNSMEPIITTGNYIITNLFTYGSRKPYWGQKHYKGKRLFGTIAVNRDDIVVFNLPIADRKKAIPQYPVIVKRCVALPCDTLLITDGTVFINNSVSNNEDKVLRQLKIKNYELRIMNYEFPVSNFKFPISSFQFQKTFSK